jgi:hypothetical protein
LIFFFIFFSLLISPIIPLLIMPPRTNPIYTSQFHNYYQFTCTEPLSLLFTPTKSI